MTARIPCLVPHCRRTKRPQPECIEVDGVENDAASEWICERHWSLVPRPTRLLYFAARRRLREHRTRRCLLLFHRLWRRCRTKAIEAAVGL